MVYGSEIVLVIGWAELGWELGLSSVCKQDEDVKAAADTNTDH